jgi:hypothetical protein
MTGGWIFWVPFMLAGLGTVHFVTTRAPWFQKLLAASSFGLTVVFSFTTWLEVPWFIPTGIQAALIVWYAVHYGLVT